MLAKFKTYQLSINLYRELQKHHLKRHLKDQLDRASSSVVLNIAEGSGKRGKDRKRFYAIALGSLRETHAIGTIADIKEEPILKLIDQIAACLYTLCFKTP